jgi:membrane protease subunit HflC
VIDAFRAVQAAQQERDRLEKEADAYANQVTAGARGEAARLLEEAEGYRAEAVNGAQGEAARFLSVFAEYVKAPEVTRRRLYLETMERVLGGMNKVILDGVAVARRGQGVVPFLPLNELGRATPAQGAGQLRRGDQLMRAMYIIPALVVLLVLVLSSVFIVDERKKALVLQFGQVMQVKEEPGLGFKVPLMQDVVYYEDRILGLQTQPIEVTLLSDRRLVVDAFARWRIVDLVEFRQAVGTGGEDRAQQLLGNILSQAIPEVLGNATQDQVLPGPHRADEPDPDHRQARRRGAGVDVIDVRLTRTDLPEQNLEATFARMRAEREREAADEKARGGEAAQRVRASADRTVVELTSDARRQAEVIRGEADAERNRILAEAYGQRPGVLRLHPLARPMRSA